jgi:hypothetical protein
LEKKVTTAKNVMHFGEFGSKKEKGLFLFYFFVFLKFIKLFLLDGFFKH